MAIKQHLTFKTSAEELYKALTTSAEFSKATGAPADIANNEGGAFSCFGGQITGRHIELVPNTRVVQAWRAGPWPDSTYSIVRFDIRQSGDSTTVDMEHTGFPEGGQDHLEGGWHKMYWDPMRAYLESH